MDGSGSTLLAHNLEQALGLVEGLNNKLYQKRERVAIIQFANQQVSTLLEPTRAPKKIRPLLRKLSAGGGTPLRQAVLQGLSLLDNEARKKPQEHQHLYLITDGRSRDALHDLNCKVEVTLIDTECGPVRLNNARVLAQQLNAHYFSIEQLKHWSEP
ncbi:VWA domain-containing protein [Aestuariirhabdus haliotis]|uniref:VWA domain-containing protein n=1 Tax=Aestuariirhabdus haliotis TaxID=2918751 RepID=UPI0029E8245C|nr:VWA domain-containing protein [Aestuariirhabdus haliotis]